LLAPWNFRQKAEAPSVIKQRGIFHQGALLRPTCLSRVTYTPSCSFIASMC
jgi:hypothetical protein